MGSKLVALFSLQAINCLVGSLVLCGVTTMRTKAEFVREWMQSESASLSEKSWNGSQSGKDLFGNPTFYIFADMDYFGLLACIGWRPTGSQRDFLLVPRGFVTDFASVPRLFWSIFPPIGKYGYPALFHDFVYWEQEISRVESDLVFRETMKELGVSKVVTSIMYAAVRLFGSFAWRKNRVAKENGEKRVLRRFPTDFSTSWTAWKQEPNVFQ
jgi:hypothetical protein